MTEYADVINRLVSTLDEIAGRCEEIAEDARFVLRADQPEEPDDKSGLSQAEWQRLLDHYKRKAEAAEREREYWKESAQDTTTLDRLIRERDEARATLRCARTYVEKWCRDDT